MMDPLPGLRYFDVTPQNLSTKAASGNYRVALFPHSDTLLIGAKEVLWYKHNLFSRKLKYENVEEPIIDAHIVNFQSKSEEPGKTKALVVVLSTRAYVYYENDESFIVSFPFNVKKSLVFDGGLILKRFFTRSQLELNSATSLNTRDGSTKTDFLTLLDPLSEFGMIVSSSISLFSANEEMLWFPKTSAYSLAVTIDEQSKTISIYHVRYLTRGKKKSSARQNSSVRRRSLSRKSSLPSSLTNDPNSSNILPISGSASKTNTNNTNSGNANGNTSDYPSDILNSTRRSISHSELAYDRMPSGNTIGDITNIDLADGSFSGGLNVNVENYRKDAILTKIESIPVQTTKETLKVFSLNFHERQAIVIINKEAKKAEVIIFGASDNFVNLPARQSSITIECTDAMDLSTNSEHEGFLLILPTDGESLALHNPFLGIWSTKITFGNKCWFSIIDYCENIVVLNDKNGINFFELILEPLDSLAKLCFEALRYIYGPYASEYVWLKWNAALSLDDTGTGWDAFVITLISIILPSNLNFNEISDIPFKNIALKLLPKVLILQSLGKSNADRQFQKSLNELAPNTILALHLLREEISLNVFKPEYSDELDILLAQLVSWIGWSDSWIDYYLGSTDKITINRVKKVEFPMTFVEPPCLLRSLSSIFDNRIVPYITFSQLAEENDAIDEIVTPRTYYVLRIFEAIVSSEYSPKDIIDLMFEYGIDLYDLESYPMGIALPLKEYLEYCKNSTSIGSSLKYADLLERKDIAKLFRGDKAGSTRITTQNNSTTTKDVNQIIQSIKNDEPMGLWDVQTEVEKLQVTKLIFSEDRRYYEITKMLQSSKVQQVSMHVTSNMNEYQIVHRQKELSTMAGIRTLTIPLGRGALFFSSKTPILSEKFPVPKLNFDTLIVPSNITLTLDKKSIPQDIIDWGYFHNGASAGLTILRDAKNIVGSWVVFNKPTYLTSQHGGFLLALGLNGHLKNLENWHMYNYMGPKHTHTSVGLLLGLSASSKGSMDMKLTKVLSVHVVALLPQGATDLNVSLPVQTAGLIGIGLLYLETQHHRMSEILLSQISNKISQNDVFIVDEGYRLAAGIALGYTNLGKGDSLNGLNDTHITDKLLALSVSLKDAQGDEEFDKSAPGAIIALGFVFIRTENQNIASKLAIPETEKLLDYIRPDLLLLRIVSKNLILWSQIGKTVSWVNAQIPRCLLGQYSIVSIDSLDSDQLPFYNCIGGACISIALKFASTGDEVASKTILYFLDQFDRLCDLPTPNVDSKLTLSSLLVIQDAIALSSAIVMAGTGDLSTFKRLRMLYKRNKKELLYSNFAAISMALGFLFMGSGEFAFNDSNFSVAALFTSIYPAPAGATESEIYLQALRHFWVLAIEPRCLIIKDVENDKPINASVNIILKTGKIIKKNAPCLIPKLNDIKQINLHSNIWYDISFDFEEINNELLESFKKTLTIFVYKKDKKVGLLDNKFNELIDKDFDLKKIDKIDESFKKLFANSYVHYDSNSKNLSVSSIRLAVKNLIESPKSTFDLWNIKLLFAFYDKNRDIETTYLPQQYVDYLKFLFGNTT